MMNGREKNTGKGKGNKERKSGTESEKDREKKGEKKNSYVTRLVHINYIKETTKR